VQPGRVQQERDEEPGEGDDDGRAGRVETPTVLPGARARPSSSFAGLHQNWK
jgi:hypothetical protein